MATALVLIPLLWQSFGSVCMAIQLPDRAGYIISGV